MALADSPLVVVIAGPNGAGKTTTAPRLLRGALSVSEFVNADPIAQGLSGFRPDTVGLAAGRVMLTRLKALATRRASFAFETTLASRSFAPWLRTLREQGFRSHVAFLSLPSVDLALARVAGRVRAGGHDVPANVVRRRFKEGLANFFDLYVPVVDSWQVLDHSAIDGPQPVAAKAPGGAAVVHDAAAWQRLQEIAR